MNEKRRSLLPYLYLTPGMLIIVTLCIYPIIYTIVLSFTNLNMYHWANPSFIGIDNFIKIFSSLDGGFIEVILRTIVWTALNMIIHVGLALVLALLLNMEKLKFKGFYRTMLILPWAVPGYISTLVWRGMFNYDFGAINQILKSIGLNSVEWLSNPKTAMIACIIVNVWLATPFMMIVCLGALQSIDKSYYEVAELDGASIFQNFRYITFPLMKPAVLPAIIITLFVTFKQFDVVYLLTRGMAGKTDLVITYAYNKAFTDYNYGYSAAFSFIIFVILLLITSFRRRMINSAEEVYNG
ncbi:carbohydrate ABC transporter permease [Clostridium manihotivorum]|uniref:Sugar ABC transporter permease n=1 Tax=Clostridium manihotivorum TaxID=2320868 RepID=A0A410E0E5_9CLOT|nr:sugar ABC transporter permease [Clostridium manihotivorum]QAA34785.1 sugar ABC transporter permease [Clostridium manihotivorum]